MSDQVLLARPVPADVRILAKITAGLGRGLRFSRLAYGPRLSRLGELVVTTPHGFDIVVDPTDHIGWSVLVSRSYEAPLSRLLKRLLNPGDVFVDVGANHGWFSLLAASLVGATGKAIAFEPQAKISNRLRTSASLNRFNNLLVRSQAVGDREMSASIVCPDPLNSGLVHVEADESSSQLSVRPLDDLLTDTTPALIKIDVEGYEARVLDGMTRLLSTRTLKHIVIEVHPALLQHYEASESAVAHRLRSRGYTLYEIRPRLDSAGEPVIIQLPDDANSLPHHLLATLR